MTATHLPIERSPDVMGGTPVFVGTRVPAQTLLDYLESGETLDAFLADFPSVTREQAVSTLDTGTALLVAQAAHG